MTKKTLQLMATLALAAGIGFSGVTAHAAEGETPAPANTTTEASVSLTAGDDGDGGGSVGGIKLMEAPATAVAGQLDGTTQTLKDTAFVKDTLKVNDQGTGTGWTVHLSSTPFAGKDKEGKDIALKASQLSFLSPKVSAVDSENHTAAPSASGIVLESAGNSDQLVFSAAKDAGVGQWAAKYQAAQVKVAAGNKAGDYSSTLTWSLNNAPSGTETPEA
ncbi:hypothetical protein FD13_GL000992 [Levilactobacillus senmaizukei DSM 21775 = NBRC 103853]|uniref:WxL domain-containing protein n=1 Tax=Levilactobacillus senmaizukei DSM 21775 = NBRC 103853 TaxID=1423803 RepID=A0A0R2DCE2_9LACO|nr:WxL domain-containing protein [Levilactobacillus senmaizukei]KRN01529.1 hypothetical protein FD13_GL000992 [Levilactobacillus senmaizukei DSM 21775 = NBRC 103853]